jgi:hypothetical protein
MNLFFISFAIYGLGCVFMMAFFMVGRSPVLVERNWPWPIIFLWPMLIFWPVHALAGLFIRRKTSQPKTTGQITVTGNSKLA